MSFLSDYDQRTAWKYQGVQGTFPTHEGLKLKVNPDGTFPPFPGSTVVFRPDRTCLQVVLQMQRVLYHHLDGSGMLAAPLPASTMHMTLHDLISPETASGSAEEYEQEVENSLRDAAEIVEDIRKQYAGKTMAMTADRIVNMVSKSLVLLLRPRTEQDGELLEALYHRFDCIRPLSYPLTPHITLAYYQPGLLDGDLLAEGIDLAGTRPGESPVFTFYPEALTVQRFHDMQHYRDIPERICFCCDGGLNRSVLAANILNHLAGEKNLPVTGEARAAYADTQGVPVSDEVWKTLEDHGLCPDREHAHARYLENREASWFTAFAGISDGALDRFARMCLPEEKVNRVTRFFYGVRDPEYGAITHEQAFQELEDRVRKYLDALEGGEEEHDRK